MKRIVLASVMIIAWALSGMQTASAQDPTVSRPQSPAPLIQVAILLDASSSMDGLIEQTKSRLWNIVNTLTTLKYQGTTPTIEIALYMYGNSGLSERENYIRQILPFTRDLDLISEMLFSIRTNGGLEYCGAVIEHSINKLEWSKNSNSMKLIYIAGNEPFTQGPVNYKEAISNAVSKDVYVNTIHCGSYEEGVRGKWKDGAMLGRGKYFHINSNEKVIYVVSPYDDELYRCNERLNRTYIYYGSYGAAGHSNQAKQDGNAASISRENVVERTVSKSKAVYSNESWDLVDKAKTDTTFYRKVEKQTLPAEYQKLSQQELKAEIAKKEQERAAIQKEIAVLSKKRQEFINNQPKTATAQDDFGKAVNTSIIEISQHKGYRMN